MASLAVAAGLYNASHHGRHRKLQNGCHYVLSAKGTWSLLVSTRVHAGAQKKTRSAPHGSPQGLTVHIYEHIHPRTPCASRAPSTKKGTKAQTLDLIGLCSERRNERSCCS